MDTRNSYDIIYVKERFIIFIVMYTTCLSALSSQKDKSFVAFFIHIISPVWTDRGKDRSRAQDGHLLNRN